MTKKELIKRYIGRSFDLLKQINNSPALLNKIPKGSFIEFVEKDFIKNESKIAPDKNRKYIRVKNDFQFS